MTYAELQTKVRFLLDEVSTNYLSDAEISTSVNDALTQMALDVDDNLTYCTYDAVASTGTYQLPSNYLHAKRLEVIVSSTRTETLDWIDINDFADVTRGATTAEGIPRWFKIELGATETTNDPQRPGDFTVYPIPDSSTYDFRLFYYKQPTALSADGDIPEWPQHIHMAIAYKAAAECAIKAKSFELANFLEGKYEKDMAKMREYYNKQQRVRPIHTKDIMGYSNVGEEWWP